MRERRADSYRPSCHAFRRWEPALLVAFGVLFDPVFQLSLVFL